MKTCPVCHRSYDDETLNFCLEDGSILSVTDDPDKTQQFFAPRETDSILTRVSYPSAKSSNDTSPPMPTMPSPQMPPNYVNNAQRQTQAVGTSSKIWLVTSLLAFLTVSIVAAILWFSAAKTPTISNNNNKNQNDNRANSNNNSQNDKKADSIFGPMNYRASMNGENLTYYPATTVEKCQADCAKNERCKGFTFIRAGAYNPNDSAMCYLASVVTEMVPHDCCISAIKR
ncbi:MAG: PAN domain-containing protein [Pyrinomonadaceae bacterium]